MFQRCAHAFYQDLDIELGQGGVTLLNMVISTSKEEIVYLVGTFLAKHILCAAYPPSFSMYNSQYTRNMPQILSSLHYERKPKVHITETFQSEEKYISKPFTLQ